MFNISLSHYDICGEILKEFCLCARSMNSYLMNRHTATKSLKLVFQNTHSDKHLVFTCVFTGSSYAMQSMQFNLTAYFFLLALRINCFFKSKDLSCRMFQEQKVI